VFYFPSNGYLIFSNFCHPTQPLSLHTCARVSIRSVTNGVSCTPSYRASTTRQAQFPNCTVTARLILTVLPSTLICG
jgi:hypothetical protein